ncbi:MAG: c-type cytochrome [Pseudomonadota bacterium]
MATAAVAAGAASAAESSGVLQLSSTYGCMSCHGMVRKQVGPGFAQIAERYRDDPEALPRTAARIRGGSVGEWGRVIMPRQPRMTEAESRLLAAWVLSQPPAK